MKEEEEFVITSFGLEMFEKIIDEKILVFLAEHEEAIEEFILVVSLLKEAQIKFLIAAEHDFLMEDKHDDERDQANEEHDEKNWKIFLEKIHVAQREFLTAKVCFVH